MSKRLERLNSLLKREIATLLQWQINDPRIPPLVSVTQVKVSPDLVHAFVGVSIMGGGKEQTMKVLENAASFIRHKLATKLSLRRMPQIHFYDDSQERGSQVLEILKELGFED